MMTLSREEIYRNRALVDAQRAAYRNTLGTEAIEAASALMNGEPEHGMQLLLQGWDESRNLARLAIMLANAPDLANEVCRRLMARIELKDCDR